MKHFDFQLILSLGKEPSEQMFVQCIWYYYPEDTHCGRIKKHHKRELFLSDLSDVNSVNSLMAPVDVLSFAEYNKKLGTLSQKGLFRLSKVRLTFDIELKNVFFCRYFYSENSKIFHSFQLDTTHGHVHIEGFEQEQRAPKNWPQDISYTPNSSWRVPEQFREYFSTRRVPFAEIRVSESTTGLFALKDIENNTILGEYSGAIALTTNQEEFEDNLTTPKDPKFFHTLYRDDEISVNLDASSSGNELRFIRQCSQEKANVKLMPTWLDGKWHFIAISTANIKQGEELSAVFIPISTNFTSSSSSPVNKQSVMEEKKAFSFTGSPSVAEISQQRASLLDSQEGSSMLVHLARVHLQGVNAQSNLYLLWRFNTILLFPFNEQHLMKRKTKDDRPNVLTFYKQ